MMNYQSILTGPHGKCRMVQALVERALNLNRALELTPEPEARRVLFIQLGEVERHLRLVYSTDDATNDVRHVPIVVQLIRSEPAHAIDGTTHTSDCRAPREASESFDVAQPQTSDETVPMTLQTKQCPNCRTNHNQATCPGELPNGDPCQLPHPDATS